MWAILPSIMPAAVCVPIAVLGQATQVLCHFCALFNEELKDGRHGERFGVSSIGGIVSGTGWIMAAAPLTTATGAAGFLFNGGYGIYFFWFSVSYGALRRRRDCMRAFGVPAIHTMAPQRVTAGVAAGVFHSSCSGVVGLAGVGY
jgi:hypothetical protein